jgi:glycosyltransferase involved in cell wall biosynthesis
VVDTASWGAEGLLYSLFKSIPLVVGVATSSSDILETKTYSGIREFFFLKVLAFTEDFTIKRADRVVAYSHQIYTRLTSKLGIVPDKVSVVHHAVDNDEYRYVESDIRQKLGVPDNAYLVLFVGRLESRKGAHILCQAIPHILERIQDVRFVLLGHDTNTAPGGGSFKQYFIDQAQNGGFSDNLLFVDFLSGNELVKLYSASDILISASLKESFGLTVIEAMSCGKPVVATSVGIVPELQHYGTKGVSVIPVGDVLMLAEAAINLLSLDDKSREELGIENRQLIERNFSINIWVAKIIEVYKQTRGAIGGSG